MPLSHMAIEVFCSYAPKDEKYRQQLETHLSALKKQGIISLWHDQQIRPGANCVKAIDEHLERASIILLLISADFMASDYCYGIEMKRALERHKAYKARVIPILVRPVDWKCAPFAHLKALPTNAKAISTWSNQDKAFENVVVGIRQTVEDLPLLSANAPCAALTATWNIPPRNPFFTGREEILTQLRARFQTGHAAALSQPQAMSGLGGIGKTQIAIEYAYLHRHEYQAGLWTLADTRESLVSGYVAIAELLNLPEKDADDQQIVIQAVKTWLQTQPSWLLILDNADELSLVREFVPSRFGGHILLTTRAQATGTRVSRIEVESMSPDLGALFLLRRAKILACDASLKDAKATDVATAHEITKELGGLPLALDQVGAYTEETNCGLRDYQSLYCTQRAAMLKARGDLVDDHDHPQPVAATWSLSFEKVELKNPAAADLLRFCAFLHPDAIPEELIMEGARHLGERLQAVETDTLLLNEMIKTLRAYSLIDRNPQEKTLSIHRLVQAVLKDGMDQQTQGDWAQRAVLAVSEAFPKVEFITWPQCERCLLHTLECVALIEQEDLTLPEAARLLNQTGRYLSDRARYAKAEPLYRRGLRIVEQSLGSDHPDVAQSLNNLANLYSEQGKYKEAEPLYRRSLHIVEQSLGSDHFDVVCPLSGLAILSKVQGRYEEAELLYQRIRSIWERSQRPEHLDVARPLNNLAVFYAEQGKYVEAELWFKDSLGIREQSLGPNHPDVAQSLNNLANLYAEQGKYKEAEPLYKRSLHIAEQSQGPEHPDVAYPLNGLAILSKVRGEYKEAEEFYQRSQRIWEQSLGSEHPQVAYSLNNQAILSKVAWNARSKVRGKYEEAEPLFQRSLDIFEQHLGRKHPHTRTCAKNYADLLHFLNRDAEAQELEKRYLFSD